MIGMTDEDVETDSSPPKKKMECDKNKGAFGRVWTRRMPLCVYSFLCTAYLKIGFESNIL